LLEGIEKKHVFQVKDKVIDYVALSKLAIDFSDGVIQSSKEINPGITDYIKEKKSSSCLMWRAKTMQMIM